MLPDLSGLEAYRQIRETDAKLPVIFITAGGTSERGWLNDQFRGDARMLANLEYSVPLFTIYGCFNPF